MPDTQDMTCDFTGLKCPLPVLKARRALKDCASGTIICILADDPAAPLDFAHFCETAHHKLISQTQDGETFYITIQKDGEAQKQG